MPFYNRKLPRKRDYDYSQDGIYFITICSEHRKRIFSHIPDSQDLETAVAELTHIGKTVDKHISKLEEKYPQITLPSYVIMPNHIHLLISVMNTENAERKSIPAIIGQLKSSITNECRRVFGTKALFQRSYYDHIVRDEKEFEKISDYIIHNPGTWIYDKLYSE